MYSGYILECINSSLFSQECQNSFICSLVFILFYYVHLYVVKKETKSRKVCILDSYKMEVWVVCFIVIYNICIYFTLEKMSGYYRIILLFQYWISSAGFWNTSTNVNWIWDNIVVLIAGCCITDCRIWMIGMHLNSTVSELVKFTSYYYIWI